MVEWGGGQRLLTRRGGWKSNDGIATDKQLWSVMEGQWWPPRHLRPYNNQLKCSSRWGTTVGWDWGQWWLKRCSGGHATVASQGTSNYGWWWRGYHGDDNNDNKTTINKFSAAEAKDDNGWQEARRSVGSRGGMCHVHFFTCWIPGGGTLYLNPNGNHTFD